MKRILAAVLVIAFTFGLAPAPAAACPPFLIPQDPGVGC